MMQQYEQAEQDYITGMKYKDIAVKYGVTINTVKSWKTRYNWIRGSDKKSDNSRHTQKSVHTKTEKVCTQIISEEKGEDGLTDRQRIFCIYFLKNHNATRSYMKAYGCKYETAAVSAHALLKNPKIKTFLDDMRTKQEEMMLIREQDVLQKYADIAFADMGDVMNPVTGELLETADTSLLTRVKPGKFGMEYTVADRMKALDKLNDYFKERRIVKENTDSEEGGIILIGEIDEQSHMETTT